MRYFLSFFVLAFSLTACQKSGTGTASKIQFKSGPKELIFNNGAEPETLDPHKMSAHDAAQLAMQLWEGLVTRSADMMDVKPGLAVSWTISPDGKVYKFKLRQGMKWSNGEAFKPEQIRASFVRAINPRVGGQFVSWYTDFIEGAKELYDGYNSPNRKELEAKLAMNLIAPDEFEIRLKRPVSYFIFLLSQTPFYTIHPSMFNPDSPAWTNPSKFITTSAYKLSEWKVNQRVVMLKNPNYYDADKVFFEKITSLPIVDEGTVKNLYQSGEIEWTGNNHISTSLVPSLNGQVDFLNDRILGVYFYLFNTKRKPFGDVRVRKALALAVDQKQITDRVLRAGQFPTHRIVPPLFQGFPSKIEDQPDMAARIKEAKRLLAEAGFSDLSKFPQVTIKYNTAEGHHKIAQAVQQMWKNNLGINVALENMEWKVFLKTQRQHDFDVIRQGWIADYPDPSTFLDIFTMTNENNHTSWFNPKFDEAVTRGTAEMDQEKRYSMLAEAEKIFYDETPGFVIYHYNYFGLANPALNLKQNSVGHYLWKDFTKKDVANSTGMN